MKAVNLLPSDLRSSPKRGAVKAPAADEPGGLGAYAVLGALALCVVALAAYVLTTNAVKDRKAQLDAATAQVQATTQRAAELKPYADFQALAETRIQTVRDLASARFDWEQALRDISRAVPDEVSLNTLNGSISTAGGGGALRGAIAAPAIELAGCTTDQKAVARLLSRLRNVDGVTRVSLAKSVKADTLATAPTDPGQGAPGCGIGRPPAFEVVIFFERSEVPATIEDVTAAPEPATTGATPSPASTGPAPVATESATSTTTPPADPAAQPQATATTATTP
jgi:Tfp pilus assembly protein PilN